MDATVILHNEWSALQGYVHYDVPSKAKSWAAIFAKMEQAKERYDIEDYSVSQTTLEQVSCG